MIVKYALKDGKPLDEHLLDTAQQHPFTPIPGALTPERDQRLVLSLCGYIDPANIHDYIAAGGYAGLAKALGRPPEDSIKDVSAAGLRGRGDRSDPLDGGKTRHA